ncbi:hypothetical protein H257_10245 [Aphanomyces astaci]|uniref:Uncharacterized protein n=1 Tax=Aphanomyces astaci TaxID=112090 RepID=W4G8L6_APHAT|nr:hypothetical protein H257_10245 [Aphanomyces astaci]ETV75394.1 hypothetical protein H257_10245 [Aphanomyces astaci]|eukprot:XP_009835028.1 hypothetical protein H257_10245 [Aphanomyces astaci]
MMYQLALLSQDDVMSWDVTNVGVCHWHTTTPALKLRCHREPARENPHEALLARCQGTDVDNGAVYLKAILRLVDWARWQVQMGPLFGAVIVPGLQPLDMCGRQPS